MICSLTNDYSITLLSRTKADDRKTSSSRLSHENKADIGATRTSGFDKGNDLDAAKFAAMRAAELGIHYFPENWPITGT